MSEEAQNGAFEQWQTTEQPFHPIWSNSGEDSFNSSANSHGGATTKVADHSHDETQIVPDTLLQKQVDEAYQRGFDEGQKVMADANTELIAVSERLSASIDSLKPVLSGQICEIILGALSALLENTAGFAVPDHEILAKRCNDLAILAQRELTNAQLHIHPADRALLGDAQIGLPVIDDPNLMRGTISIAHQDGYLEQGTQPVLDELKAMIDALELAR